MASNLEIIHVVWHEQLLLLLLLLVIFIPRLLSKASYHRYHLVLEREISISINELQEKHLYYSGIRIAPPSHISELALFRFQYMCHICDIYLTNVTSLYGAQGGFSDVGWRGSSETLDRIKRQVGKRRAIKGEVFDFSQIPLVAHSV